MIIGERQSTRSPGSDTDHPIWLSNRQGLKHVRKGVGRHLAPLLALTAEVLAVPCQVVIVIWRQQGHSDSCILECLGDVYLREILSILHNQSQRKLGPATQALLVQATPSSCILRKSTLECIQEIA